MNKVVVLHLVRVYENAMANYDAEVKNFIGKSREECREKACKHLEEVFVEKYDEPITKHISSNTEIFMKEDLDSTNAFRIRLNNYREIFEDLSGNEISYFEDYSCYRISNNELEVVYGSNN
jgi:hypothetical protein